MKLYITILVFFTACIANAADIPQSSKFDNRIQYVNYNPGDVVVVRAITGFGTRIVFAQNETIIDVASGWTQGWEFSDRRNILYIKPKSVVIGQGVPPMAPEAGKWDTNLMVTTNLRLYDMDLHLLPNNDLGQAPMNLIAYRIEYRYPDDEQAELNAIAKKERVQTMLDEKPAPQNWNYSMQVGDKSENIAPTMAFDDGRFTYLKFPNNRDFPVAFLVASDKSESLVNSHIDPDMPDTLVLHRVAREMVLRLGTAVVGIYNDSFDEDGIPAHQGTTLPSVKRVILSGEKNR